MPKNIWVAAGDGDLSRVTELIEQHSLSPNIPDPYTYTPMHAAASYGHLHVLEYLISRGGNVNVTDNDGDTPLYVVENVETARFLVDHGATVARQNNEGLSPIDHLTEEFPQIADYLRQTQTPSSPDLTPPPPLASNSSPSQYSQNVASEQLTSGLMSSVQHILEQAEVEGREPNEEEIRQAVSRTVIEGVLTGYGMCEDGIPRDRDNLDDTATKRRRDEDSR